MSADDATDGRADDSSDGTAIQTTKYTSYDNTNHATDYDPFDKTVIPTIIDTDKTTNEPTNGSTNDTANESTISRTFVPPYNSAFPYSYVEANWTANSSTHRAADYSAY